MSQEREKWDSLILSRADFWMIWRWHHFPCFHFYFLFRNNVKREQLDENNFHHCYGNFFSKVSFWKYKVLSQRLRGILATAFERHVTVEDFTDMDQYRCRACSSKNTAIRHLTYYCSFSFFHTSLVYKYNVVLIE